MHDISVVALYDMSTHEEWQYDVDMWVASEFENSIQGALDYLKHRMYVKFDMKALRVKGTWIRNKARTLWRYRNQIVEVSASERRMLAKLG